MLSNFILLLLLIFAYGCMLYALTRDDGGGCLYDEERCKYCPFYTEECKTRFAKQKESESKNEDDQDGEDDHYDI